MTSDRGTGHQWDAPNAWPPLQHLVVEALAGSGVQGGPEEARRLAGARCWGRG